MSEFPHHCPPVRPRSRRDFLGRTGSAVLGLGFLAASRLRAQEDANDGGAAAGEKVRELTLEELVTPETRRAIDRGLAYLAKKQERNGSARGAFGTSNYSGSVGICGLGGLAFMAGGSTPGSGPYGREVDACADFIARNTDAKGYIAGASGGVGNMYGHGFAALCLSQVYGMTRNEEVGDALRRAVACILASQSDEGGWRYQPVKSSADLSVTVCQIMALRAARDAGVNVPDSVRDKCIEYVKKSQNVDGSFRYTLQGGHSTFALTAAGLVSLYSAGIYDGKAIETGLQFLKRREKQVERHYYYYAHYYAVQAMWHAGGKWWNDWYPNIRQELLASQSDGGAWIEPSYGNEFATAMACIILQMPYDMLPIFAR